MEGFNNRIVDENEAQKKIDELQDLLDKLVEKEDVVKNVYCDCEKLTQHSDIQNLVKVLLLELTSISEVIRENQNFIRSNIHKLKDVEPTVIKQESIDVQQPIVEQQIVEHVKPETQAISTQTIRELPTTDNIMVIQSVNDEGETIQIYNMTNLPGNEGTSQDVILEAKYSRSTSGEHKRGSELLLKNVPHHFETTFTEPDETTTEIFVDPDGSKRIIVRKLTKSTQQIIQQDGSQSIMPPEMQAKLGFSGTTHDVIVSCTDSALSPIELEQHPDIEESTLHAVIEHVSRRVIRKTRRIIKKITIIDGKEHITEEIVEEPDEVEEYSDNFPETDLNTSEIGYEISRSAPIQDIVEIKEDFVEPKALSGPSDDQVFEKIHAQVELNASPVDTQSPVEIDTRNSEIEQLDNIWPYYVAHSSQPQTKLSDDIELPAAVENFKERVDVWPQNLTVGSDVDLDEYTFDKLIPLAEIPVEHGQSLEIVDSIVDRIIAASIVDPEKQIPSQDTSDSVDLSSRYIDEEVDFTDLDEFLPVKKEPAHEIVEKVLPTPEPVLEQAPVELDTNVEQTKDLQVIIPPLDPIDELQKMLTPTEVFEEIDQIISEQIEFIEQIPSAPEILDVTFEKTETVKEPTIIKEEVLVKSAPVIEKLEIRSMSVEEPTQMPEEEILPQPEHLAIVEITQINLVGIQAPIESTTVLEIEKLVQTEIEKPIEQEVQQIIVEVPENQPEVIDIILQDEQNPADIEITISSFEPPHHDEVEPVIPQIEEDLDTYQVTVKVNPNEVSKINLNITEDIQIDLNVTDQEPVQEPVIQSIESSKKVTPAHSDSFESSDNLKKGQTGYEIDKSDPEDHSGGDKKKKKKKKKQKVKPEDQPTFVPKSTESGAQHSDILSSENENPIQDEEILPEGSLKEITPDESYKSISEVDETSVRVLEQGLLTSPEESLQIDPNSGVVYPSNVVEFTYVGDNEQQTDPIEFGDTQQEIKEPIQIDTKEIQTLIDSQDGSTQMSPALDKKMSSEQEIQTITLQFIEAESQTSLPHIPTESVPPKDQQEQEMQTDDIVLEAVIADTTDISIQTSDHGHEESMQTELDTKEAGLQTDDEEEKPVSEDNKVFISSIVSDIFEKVFKGENQLKSVEEPPKPEQVIAPVVEEVPADTAGIQTKSKKSKKSKKKNGKEIEIEIQTSIDNRLNLEPDMEAKHTINVTVTSNDQKPVDDAVSVNVSLVQTAQPPQEDPDNIVLRRLDDLLQKESSPPMNDQNLTLSQHLGVLLNNIDQQYLDEDAASEITEDLENSLQKADQYINLLPEIVNSGQDKLTQKTVMVITKVIVTCLEQVEYNIRYRKLVKPKEITIPSELEKLDDLLNNLKQNVAPIKNIELRAEINKCINTLQHHVELDKDIENSVVEEIKDYYSELNGLDDAVQKLREETNNLIKQLRFVSASNIPIEEKLVQLENLEILIKDNKKQSIKLLRHNSISEPQKHDVKVCHDQSKDAEHNIKLEKRRLLMLINLSEEYEQTLNEFSQITLIADTLVDKTVVTNSLEHLQNEIQRHRKFFVNLNHCRNILESLEKNLDAETRQKHAHLHNSLHSKATVILEKAGDRSQKLSLAASRWMTLDTRMNNEDQWLQVAEQRVPDLSTVTSADYDQYITLYQSLTTDISNHHSKMLQNYEMANKLQDLICAPNLETRCNDSLTKIVKMKEDVQYYSKKLLMFKNMWTEYNSNADRLENWMNGIEDELTRVEIPTSYLDYPIENMRNFWEIKAQYEMHNQIHDNVGDSFSKALKIISIADDKLQLQFYSQLEDRWITVTQRISAIKTQITDNISSTIPSYNDKLTFLERELDELYYILNNIKGIIRNPEELNLYIERLIVLKSRITVVENELVTIGFISTTDTERVGELCVRSHKISNLITEELELADLCKGRLNTLRQEIEDIRMNQQGFYDNLAHFENSAKLESAAIDRALNDCHQMKEDLVLHWQEIMRSRHLLHTLPTGLRMTVSPVMLEKDISELEDDFVDIEKRLSDIENLLKNRFGLWKRFEKQLEIIQQSVQETDFMVELLTVHGNIDYDRLLKATERLEVNFIF